MNIYLIGIMVGLLLLLSLTYNISKKLSRRTVFILFIFNYIVTSFLAYQYKMYLVNIEVYFFTVYVITIGFLHLTIELTLLLSNKGKYETETRYFLKSDFKRF